MSFPPYRDYKESGVEWLGELPAHWEVTKLGSTLIEPPCYGVLVPDFDPDGIPMLRITDIDRGRAERAALVTISEALSRLYMRSVVQQGDVALSVVGTIGEAIKIDRELAGVNLSRAVARLQPSGKMSADFMCWMFQSIPFRRFVDLVCVGTAQRVLNMSDLSSFRFGLPSADEQSAIAAFLDREAAKIDALVVEQTRLINLLTEKRHAVVSHAVTKGLDPNAPMKNSGVEWLGEVPERWAVARLKRISPEITVGIVVEPSKYYVDDGVPALRSLNIRQGAVDTKECVFISAEANDFLKKSQLRKGDLVAVRTGQPGTTAVIPPELDGCNCIDLIIIRKPEAGSERYLCWYLASDIAVRQFAEGSGGAIQQHFNVSTAMDLVVTWPSASEQDAIAAFLDTVTSHIDELSADAQTAIDLLQERRAALISAAVTGKIDVRGLAKRTTPAPDVVAA